MRARSRKSKQRELPPWPAVVAATLPPGRVYSPHAGVDFKGELAKGLGDGDGIIVLDAPTSAPPDAKRDAVLLGLAKGKLLLGAADSPAARSAWAVLGLTVFKAAGADDRLFACNYELDADLIDARAVEKVAVQKPFAGFADFDACVAAQEAKGHDAEAARAICGKLQAAADVSKGQEVLDALIRIIKSEEETEVEERIVYGIVLEPDGVDAQNDTISAAEIRQAAHRFMQEFANVGLQHQAFINGKARILETFVAPADFELNGQTVRKGTWVMAMRIIDDEIWAGVKAGKITGFSIGGSAVRKPA